MCDRCDELEERVSELEETVEFLTQSLFDLEDEVVGEAGVAGLNSDLNARDHDSLAAWVAAIEDGTTQSGVSPAVRESLLEIHADWIDIREGRTEQFTNEANRRRAAKVFARFIEKIRPDSAETGVIADQGTLKLSGDRAQEIIAAEDTLPQSGRSITVRRVFGRLVRGANRHDCACKDWAECAHGLFRFRNAEGYQLAVEEADWREYLRTVVETIEEVEAVSAADDEPDGSEDQADVRSEMDDLLTAEVADD